MIPLQPRQTTRHDRGAPGTEQWLAGSLGESIETAFVRGPSSACAIIAQMLSGAGFRETGRYSCEIQTKYAPPAPSDAPARFWIALCSNRPPDRDTAVRPSIAPSRWASASHMRRASRAPAPHHDRGAVRSATTERAKEAGETGAYASGASPPLVCHLALACSVDARLWTPSHPDAK
jgi:hypothetical protein